MSREFGGPTLWRVGARCAGWFPLTAPAQQQGTRPASIAVARAKSRCEQQERRYRLWWRPL